MPRSLGRLTCLLASTLFLSAALAGCGDDITPPQPAVDAGEADGGPRDAGLPDAGQVDAGHADAGECADFDGDGHPDVACGGDDCDDHDSSRYPGATEVCDLDDEDCDDTTFGPDGDGDGFASFECCSDAGTCGTDCNDTDSNVHSGATETCDGIDNDCDTSIDEGVCVPCATGYTGFDGTCTDIDECLIATTCGAGRASCTNTDGSYECGCDAGYVASAMGSICIDVNECVTSAPCGLAATACTNTFGGYMCGCAPGYGAPAAGGTCTDVDECAAGTCGVGVIGCVNSIGSYACTCGLGYTSPATGGPCMDINECATGTPCTDGLGTCTNTSGSYRCDCLPGYAAPATGGTCANVDECALVGMCGAAVASCFDTDGSYLCECVPGYAAPLTGGACDDIDECALGICGVGFAACINTPGSYECSCSAGYTAASSGEPCVDIDECALGTDTCDRDPPALCTNVDGSFTCTCPDRFVGDAQGPSGCLLDDPSLQWLTPSLGTLSPTFSGTTTRYTLALPPGVMSATLAFVPMVADPTHSIVEINGVIVSSGTPSPALTVTLTGYAASAPVNITVTTETGATRTYTVVIGRGSTYVKASNTNVMDQFGAGIALSADGSTLAVGARYEASNATGINGSQTNNAASYSGAVYVFARVAGAWVQQAYVKASNTGASDQFGGVLALSADGSTLAVGVLNEDSSAMGINGDQASNGARDSGAVYVFSRTGTTWAQQAYIKASNTGVNDQFGGAIALSGDGSTLAVSARAESSGATGVDGDQTDNSASGAGAVYVYSRTGTTWSQHTYIKASNAASMDLFGDSVALSDDGSTLAVGAYNEGSNAVGIDGDQANDLTSGAGAVYVFTRAGTTWLQSAYIKASNTDVNDMFGWALALSGDGTTLAVGVPYEDSNAVGVNGDQSANALQNPGAVYVFVNDAGTWSQQAYMKASNTGADAHFGATMAVASDGSTLAIGAPAERSLACGIGGDQTADSFWGDLGAVYLFRRTGTAWSQEAYMKASNTRGGTAFGVSLALSADASLLAVGGSGDSSNATGVGGNQTNNSAYYSGAIYVF